MEPDSTAEESTAQSKRKGGGGSPIVGDGGARHLLQTINDPSATTPTTLQNMQRHLQFVDYDYDSAEIYGFDDTPCPTSVVSALARQALPNSTNCITVFGRYRIVAARTASCIEDLNEVYVRFQNATQEAIASGALEEAFQVAIELLWYQPVAAFTVAGISPIKDTRFDAFTEVSDDGSASETSTIAIGPDVADVLDVTDAPVVGSTSQAETDAPTTVLPSSDSSKTNQGVSAADGHGTHHRSAVFSII